MIEAQILCSQECDIPDLGIFGLKRGEERWVTLAAAEGSQDLDKEQRKGNVRVFRKVRRTGTAPRRPVPPFVVGSRPQRTQPQAQPQAEPAMEGLEDLVRKMKAEILEGLLPGLQEAVAQEVGKVLAQETPAPDLSQLETALENVLRRISVPGALPASPVGAGSSVRPPADPLFIPSTIVDKDAKGKITVKSKKSETDALDDAQAVLRALKRSKMNNEEP